MQGTILGDLTDKVGSLESLELPKLRAKQLRLSPCLFLNIPAHVA